MGANPFLLGFKCGAVFDTINMKYHVGIPTDMLVKVLKHTRAEVEAVDRDIEAQIRRCLSEIMTTKEAATCIHDLLSYIVSGNRLGQRTILFHGSGSNRKSVLERLIRTILGMHCVVREIKLITKKGGAAKGAESKLMSTHGALCALFPEPNARDKLNSGKLKQPTGKDGFKLESCMGWRRRTRLACKISSDANSLLT